MTALLVAATGGHLAQLDRLAPRITGVDGDAVWVTFDTPQSRSLLRDRPHVFVPYSGPRDVPNVLRNVHVAAGIIRRVQPTVVVSTGNSIAVSFLPVARAMGVPGAYIESAARTDGPSRTGRILRCVPGVQLFAQYASWAGGPWHYVGSVFDDFSRGSVREPKPIERVVVTLGTIKYGFRRLLERLVAILPEESEVVWQVGETDATGLGIFTRKVIPHAELQAEMRAADVVVAHAGIGSALAALDVGKCPLLAPRERRYREHVDNHQNQIASALSALGLAVAHDAGSLTLDDLLDASRRTIIANPDASSIDLRRSR
jgi:UDP-N-acetylglucosamine transferase subunit ALG13